MRPIPLEAMREYLSYDPETGHFTWIKFKGSKSPAGSIAGGLNPMGYVCIGFFGVRYIAHRMAWAFVHGESPPMEIDHINGCKSDNRIVNLRLATHAQNMANLPDSKFSRTGIRGVMFRNNSSRPWWARVRQNQKMVVIGRFDTPEEADAAYKAEMERLRGQFAAHISRASE